MSPNVVSNLTLHGTAGNRNVGAGQILVFEITLAGSPDALVDAVLELDLEATA